MTGRRSQPWPQPARASRSQPAAGTRKGTQTPPVRRARPQGCALRFTRRGTNQAPRQLEAPNAARPPPAQRRSLRPSTTQPPLLSPPPRGAQARAEGGTARPPHGLLPFFLSQAAESAKSHGSRLRRGAALPSNPRARWVTQGRQRPLPSNPGSKLFLLTGTSSRRPAFSAACWTQPILQARAAAGAE